MQRLIEKFVDPNVEIRTFRKMYKMVHIGLWINGVYPDQGKTKHRIWRVVNMVLLISGVLLLAKAAYLDIKAKDYSDATRQVSIVTLIIIMILKFLNMIYNKNTFKSLISRMDSTYDSAKISSNVEERRIVHHSIQCSIVIQNLWAMQVILVGCVFSFSAFGIMIYLFLGSHQFERKMVFYTILPYYDNLKFTTPVYELFMIYELLINFIVTILYVSYDSLLPTFTFYMCGQFEVVKNKIKDVIKQDENTEKSNREIHEKLVDIIEELKLIYKFGEDVNKATSYVSQFIFSITPIISTASGFQIYSMLKNGEIPYEFMFFFGATIFHVFMPSYFGNLLEEKSRSIGDALYSCGWEDCPNISIRKTILLMIVRSQKAIVFQTVFSTISLLLFSEVCQTTWAVFNLLIVAFDI